MLIESGMDDDLAFAMNHTMRKAAIIVFGKLKGGNWSWDSMNWIEER
jgi:hypothetical protein